MTIVSFTGIRNIDDGMFEEIELAVLDEIGTGATELRFGGATGADTFALDAACDASVRRVVYLPFRLRDQSSEARDVIEDCADEVIELGRRRGSRDAYMERNRALVDGADRVVGFWDGRRGGTSYTLDYAHRRGIPVSIVPVLGRSRKGNPELRGIEFSAKVYALAEYVSSKDGKHRLSDLIRQNKSGEANPRKLQALARQLADFIERTPALRAAQGIVAMPRRQPGRRSDMASLARSVAQIRKLSVYDLVRTKEPLGGLEMARRLRFPADEHAKTLRYDGPRDVTVIVLDNATTTGATMEGALRAILATGATPLGLSVLFSESFGIEPF